MLERLRDREGDIVLPEHIVVPKYSYLMLLQEDVALDLQHQVVHRYDPN